MLYMSRPMLSSLFVIQVRLRAPAEAAAVSAVFLYLLPIHAHEACVVFIALSTIDRKRDVDLRLFFWLCLEDLD